MQSVMTVIGLMSGSGLEGIDIALVATDGERRLERRQSLTFPLTPEQRKSLSKAIAAGHAARIERDLVAFCAGIHSAERRPHVEDAGSLFLPRAAFDRGVH